MQVDAIPIHQITNAHFYKCNLHVDLRLFLDNLLNYPCFGRSYWIFEHLRDSDKCYINCFCGTVHCPGSAAVSVTFYFLCNFVICNHIECNRGPIFCQ